MSLPRPHAALRIGITGHRPHRLPPDLSPLRARLAEALGAIAVRLEDIRRENAGRFGNEAASLTLVSPLAAGADSMAAEAALAAGYGLDVCMPFAPERYRKDFSAEERPVFERLLARADRVLSLPGERLSDEESYYAIGATVVEQCDLLLAIWDGKHSGGRGGTADIVELSLASGTPVLWFDPTGTSAPRMAWPDREGSARGLVIVDPALWSEATPDRVDWIVDTLATPPDDTDEQALDRHLTRRSRAWPTLMAVLGADSWGKALRGRPPDYGDAAIRSSLSAFGNDAASSFLVRRYDVADRLATALGQQLRSAFVGNFVLGALAVALALAGLILPDAKPGLVLAELLVILLIIVRTRQATRQGWHRRWIDLRNLAEQLRVLPLSASLGNLGLGIGPESLGWSRWYAQASARELGMPGGHLTESRIADIRDRAIALVDDQAAYHRSNAARMGKAERRLRHLGDVLFSLTIVCGVAWLALTGLGLGHVKILSTDAAKWTTFFTALFPAVGAALYGIRMQGEFAAGQERSQDLERVLVALRSDMAADAVDDRHVAARLRQLSAILGSELDQWRSLSEKRPLELPG